MLHGYRFLNDGFDQQGDKHAKIIGDVSFDGSGGARLQGGYMSLGDIEYPEEFFVVIAIQGINNRERSDIVPVISCYDHHI